MSALHDFLSVQVPNEKLIRADLRAASEEIHKIIAKELRSVNTRASAANVRIAQYRIVQANIRNTLRELWNEELFPLIGEGSKAAAAEAGAIDVLNSLISEQLGISERSWEASMRRTAVNNMDAYRERMEGRSYQPLSVRVYRNEELSKGLVDRTINMALIQGKSAKELAADVVGLINPDVPGGVSYSALRLGRTELNNAFHATAVHHHGDQPWVKGMEWHLSSSHPRSDVCNSLVGEYAPGKTPGKPHPNCFCYVTPISIAEDQFIDRYKKGEFDSAIDDLLGDTSSPASLSASSVSKINSPAQIISSSKSPVKPEAPKKILSKIDTPKATRKIDAPVSSAPAILSPTEKKKLDRILSRMVTSKVTGKKIPLNRLSKDAIIRNLSGEEKKLAERWAGSSGSTGQVSFKTSLRNTRLTDEQKATIYDYAWDGNTYQDVNVALRRGGEVSAQVRKKADEITRVISSKTIDENVIAYRGAANSPELVRMLEQGGDFQDNGFISTSLDKSVSLEDFADVGSNQVLMTIEVPKGTNAIYLGDQLDDLGAFDQQELLLQRGTMFKVVSTSMRGGVLHARLRVIAQIP